MERLRRRIVEEEVQNLKLTLETIKKMVKQIQDESTKQPVLSTLTDIDTLLRPIEDILV
jgi:Cys-tRNA synthase (O-phospho-L-seryl-tRNA:Cys-tRNA synthase)